MPLSEPSRFERAPFDRSGIHPRNMAERKGVEPLRRIAATIRLPTGALRPLVHLSLNGEVVRDSNPPCLPYAPLLNPARPFAATRGGVHSHDTSTPSARGSSRAPTSNWQRVRESNPRRDRSPSGIQSRRDRPLRQPSMTGVSYGFRTRVLALKGRCPRPLDEGDNETLVEVVGFDPTRVCLQGRCSPRLSYTPTKTGPFGPTRTDTPCGHLVLNQARLPIPPQRE